ncbi:MAG: PilZ domain-containing protein [Candidatus Eremiobacteraeota bacterium]|nr:PilZ domain-containing protein [Candidatus Eremiobacteraeota bacterium]
MFDSLLKAVFGKRAAYTRRWPRLIMTEPARLGLPDGREIPVMLVQLSAGGARLQSAARLKPGETVILSVEIGLGLKRDITAQVLHVRKDAKGFYYTSGLCFIDIDPLKIRSIAAYIADEQQRRRQGMPLSHT